MVSKKIVSLIPSYNPHNDHVKRVVRELNKSTRVILFTTEAHDLHVHETVFYEKEVGRELVYKPRKWIVDNMHLDWDYVLYNEDDIFISEQSLNNVIKLYESLPSPLIPGFIRYEYDPRDNTKRYFDMYHIHAIHRGSQGTVKEVFLDKQVWEPWNLHSGNWLFSKEDIKNMIQNDVFETYYKEKGFMYGNCDQLESASSVPYMFYTKVYPHDFESVEVEHLPKKYIYLDPNPNKEDLQNLLNL